MPSALDFLKPKRFVRLALGAWYSYRLTGRAFPAKVVLRSHRCRLRLEVSRKARVDLGGPLILETWMGDATPVFLKLSKGSRFETKGAFTLGPGVRIAVGDDARFSVGAPVREKESGITEQARILVKNEIIIGDDFLCAWNLFLTDSDHHGYGSDRPATAPVRIGHHVWLGPNCSVLKGARIGDACVAVNGALIREGDYPEKSLLAGSPAKVVGAAKPWTR